MAPGPGDAQHSRGWCETQGAIRRNSSDNSRNTLRVLDFMRTLKSDPDSQQPTAATRPGHSARCQARFPPPALTGKGITAMTEQPAPQGPTTTLPPQSANGTSAQLPLAHSPRKS